MLGTMPLWEPPPHDLDCPLALPGEGEAGMDVGPERWVDGSSQVSKALPVHLFQAEGAMLWWGGGLGV